MKLVLESFPKFQAGDYIEQALPQERSFSMLARLVLHREEQISPFFTLISVSLLYTKRRQSQRRNKIYLVNNFVRNRLLEGQ